MNAANAARTAIDLAVDHAYDVLAAAEQAEADATDALEAAEEARKLATNEYEALTTAQNALKRIAIEPLDTVG